MAGEEDKALGDFFSMFDQKVQSEERRATFDERIIASKKEKLEPVAKFLRRLTAMGLTVRDSDAGIGGIPLASTKKFEFYEAASSPSWAPGVSLFFDHPIQAEIAVPNDMDVEKMGAVVVGIGSRHPDAGMLQQKFKTVEALKETLAKFMAKNTLSIERDPRRTPPSQPRISQEEAKARLAKASEEPPPAG